MQCSFTPTSGADDMQWPRNHVAGDAPDTLCVEGIVFADPELGALADNGGPTPTLVPAPGSPLRGAARDCPATDQRGQPRNPSAMHDRSGRVADAAAGRADGPAGGASGGAAAFGDRDSLTAGAVVLRRFASPVDRALWEQVQRLGAAAPFRHMETPGGFSMAVAMTNCGALGWVTDRRGYRYDPCRSARRPAVAADAGRVPRRWRRKRPRPRASTASSRMPA